MIQVCDGVNVLIGFEVVVLQQNKLTLWDHRPPPGEISNMITGCIDDCLAGIDLACWFLSSNIDCVAVIAAIIQAKHIFGDSFEPPLRYDIIDIDLIGDGLAGWIDIKGANLSDLQTWFLEHEERQGTQPAAENVYQPEVLLELDQFRDGPCLALHLPVGQRIIPRGFRKAQDCASEVGIRSGTFIR